MFSTKLWGAAAAAMYIGRKEGHGKASVMPRVAERLPGPYGAGCQLPSHTFTSPGLPKSQAGIVLQLLCAVRHSLVKAFLSQTALPWPIHAVLNTSLSAAPTIPLWETLLLPWNIILLPLCHPSECSTIPKTGRSLPSCSPSFAFMAHSTPGSHLP